MGKQFLIPVKNTKDATEALARIPGVAQQGDELVVLIVSDIPEGELIGSRPASTVVDPMNTTGGTSSEPRTSDEPEFLGREEMMEIKGRELIESLEPQIVDLHQNGYEARAEAVFSDEPGVTIRDYASDLNVTDVYMTEAFRSDLDAESQETVRAL